MSPTVYVGVDEVAITAALIAAAAAEWNLRKGVWRWMIREALKAVKFMACPEERLSLAGFTRRLSAEDDTTFRGWRMDAQRISNYDG